MSETHEGPGNPPPGPKSDEVTEPTPTATNEPTTEPTSAVTGTPTAEMPGTAPHTAESRARWRWPEKTRNRIAASVAIAAGGVAIVAAVFIGGFAVGSHTGGYGEFHDRSSHQSEMSAHREHTPMEQIWIIPGDGSTGAPNGFIITGTESASTTSPS
jgi:hypothetical protein